MEMVPAWFVTSFRPKRADLKGEMPQTVSSSPQLRRGQGRIQGLLSFLEG